MAPTLLWGTLGLAACVTRPPAAIPPCGSDRDCKLERICERGICVWPAPLAARAPATPTLRPDAGLGDAGASAFGPALGGGFTMFRQEPLHRGRSPHVLPEEAPSIAWTYRTSAPVTSSPALATDGTVVFGGHDGKIHVVDPSGQGRFTLQTGDLIFGSPAVDERGDILLGSGDDHLYKVDLERRVLAWRLKLGTCKATRGVGPEASRCDVDGGPTVGPDGTLYVGGDGLFAIAPEGRIRWHFATPRRVPTAPTLHPAGLVLVGGQDDTLYALSPEGKKLWDFRAGDDIESTPAVGDDGTIYFGADDQKIYALTPEGALLWAFSTGDDVRASPAIGRNGHILVGSFDGLFYALTPEGTLAWSFRAGDRIVSSALVDARGAILFGSQDDRLYALEGDGTLRWSVALGGDIDSSPTLGPEGTIYVGSDDGNLYALRAP